MQVDWGEVVVDGFEGQTVTCRASSSWKWFRDPACFVAASAEREACHAEYSSGDTTTVLVGPGTRVVIVVVGVTIEGDVVLVMNWIDVTVGTGGGVGVTVTTGTLWVVDRDVDREVLLVGVFRELLCLLIVVCE